LRSWTWVRKGVEADQAGDGPKGARQRTKKATRGIPPFKDERGSMKLQRQTFGKVGMTLVQVKVFGGATFEM